MSVAHDSVLLNESWQRAWIAAGGHSDGGTLAGELVARYSEPQRKYHTLQHLSECLSAFAPVRGLAVRPGEVELGIWFHDAIYDVHRHDNEQRSAEWARTALLEAGVAGEVALRVEALVLATRHSLPAGSPDEQLLVDIDLSILGAPADRYAEYERQVRAEYAFVPAWLFTRKRRAILRSFLDRPRIYGTDHIRASLEERARANLRSSLSP
jgi:predicted metal-dependent HD superfamily phosphohydrolase